MLNSLLRPYWLILLILISPYAHSGESCIGLLSPTTPESQEQLEAFWSFLPGEVEVLPAQIDLKPYQEQSVDQSLVREAKIFPDPEFIEVTEKQKVVMYPASGYDIAGGFRMFPNADVVIGFDNHPFVAPQEDPNQIDSAASNTLKIRAIKNAVSTTTTWTVVTDVDQLGSMASAQIAQLKTFFPEARVYQVIEISQQGNSHGIIEFDLGLKTPRRKFVHLQVYGGQKLYLYSGATGGLKLDAEILNSLFTRFHPDALMFKASMSLNLIALSPPSKDLEARQGGDLMAAVRPMAHYISQTGGIIVDGDSEPVTNTGSQLLKLDPELTPQVVEVLRSQISHWGYSTPRLYRFKE